MSAAAVVTPPASAGFRWPPTTAMAWVTFLEFWRRWFFLGLLVIGLLPGLLATFLPGDAQRGAERVELVILWGMGGIAFGGALGACIMGSLQTPLEIEDRRIYGLVCRPIGRWRILVGKMIGIAGFLLLYAVICLAAISAMIGLTLHGQPDADRYLVTRRATPATMLGTNLNPAHIRMLGAETEFQQKIDFTRLGPIPDWGKSRQERYRWVLVTVVRGASGPALPPGGWPNDRNAFQVAVGPQLIPMLETFEDEIIPQRDWFLENTGHAVLIIPESYMAAQPPQAVALTFHLHPDFFHPGDLWFFSDLASYDKPNPPYDSRLKTRIPFGKTILTVGDGQSVDYLLTPPPGEPPPAPESAYIGLRLKSATIFRDIFSVDAALLRLTPDQGIYQALRKETWIVHEKKTVWARLVATPGLDPLKNPSFGPAGPDLTAADGWRILRLTGRKPIAGDGNSGALFQLENQGDIQLAVAKSNLWLNVAMGTGLFFIQWLCLTVVVVAWSGNLSLGVSLLCALILAVACYGSGSARSVLTEEHRNYEYRTEMLKKHPEWQVEPIAGWQFALNRVMYAIVWTPPNFLEYSPTERVKTQHDIGLESWTGAVFNLLLLRSVPVALVGLLIFQRREF